MTKKFNSKIYQWKKRLYLPIQGHANISRYYIWDEVKKEYCSPKSGKKIFARRYEPNNTGGEKRVTRYFKNLGDALSWQSFRKRSQHLVTNSRDGSAYTFFNLYKDYEKHRLPLLSYGSRVNYEKALRHFEFFFDLPVEQFSPIQIDLWLNFLKEPERLKAYKKSRRSFEREIDLLKAILNWHIERKPDSKLIIPFKKYHQEMMRIKPKRSSKPRFMTPSQRDLWWEHLAKVSPNFLAPGIIQTEQILRVSEVFAMKWSNLDLENAIYRFTEHIIYTRRKGEKPFVIPSASKTEKEGGFFISHLREVSVEALKRLKRKACCDLIFHNDGKLVTYRQIQYAYDKAFKSAGLPFTSTHICRHTGSTCFLDETGDPLALQQMGNWATQKQAMHYGQIMKDRSRLAVMKADKKRKLQLIQGSFQNAIG